MDNFEVGFITGCVVLVCGMALAALVLTIAMMPWTLAVVGFPVVCGGIAVLAGKRPK